MHIGMVITIILISMVVVFFLSFFFLFFHFKENVRIAICANCQMRDRESIRDLKREKEKHDFTDSGREFHDLIAEGKNELKYIEVLQNIGEKLKIEW